MGDYAEPPPPDTCHSTTTTSGRRTEDTGRDLAHFCLKCRDFLCETCALLTPWLVPAGGVPTPVPLTELQRPERQKQVSWGRSGWCMKGWKICKESHFIAIFWHNVWPEGCVQSSSDPGNTVRKVVWVQGTSWCAGWHCQCCPSILANTKWFITEEGPFSSAHLTAGS